MLKKSQRLTTEEVNLLMEKGKIAYSTLFTLRFTAGQTKTKFAAIAPKKIAKTAVARNLARRRVYEALALLINDPLKSGCHVAILCKEKAIGIAPKALAADLKTLLGKANIL